MNDFSHDMTKLIYIVILFLNLIKKNYCIRKAVKIKLNQ